MGLPGWRRVTQGQQNNQGGHDLSSGLPCGRGHPGFSWATAAGTCFCCLPAAVCVAILPISLLKPPGQLPSSLSSINQEKPHGRFLSCHLLQHWHQLGDTTNTLLPQMQPLPIPQQGHFVLCPGHGRKQHKEQNQNQNSLLLLSSKS